MSGSLWVRPTNGLCNRLGVVSSFAVLARRSGRDLRVCWTSGVGWSDEDLEDLFENRVERITAAEFERACEHAVCLHHQLTVAGLGGLNETWQDRRRPGFAGVFDVPAYPVVAYEGFRRCQDLIAPERRRRLLPGFTHEFESELRGWRPLAAIREQVADLAAGFDDDTVGVHIRRGDMLAGSWSKSGYGRSTDAAFMARMDRILAARPRTTFFLATDCLETQERFRARYGSRILVNPDKRFVPSVRLAPKDNQRDAVVDLFALARTGTILGSHYSSFSVTAAALARVRLQVVVEDPWIDRLRRRARFARGEFMRRGADLRERLTRR